MAELATIARPYADALFKAQTADLAGTAAWLDELAAVASNSQLLQFSENPKVTDAQVF
jgi:F-type H+-transporting ATPase subunit delta